MRIKITRPTIAGPGTPLFAPKIGEKKIMECDNHPETAIYKVLGHYPLINTFSFGTT